MGAMVNLRTGKIIGAKRGNFAFFHECGHIAYDNSEEGIKDGLYQNYAMYLGLLFLALGQFWFTFKLLAISSVIMIFYYFLKEEWWCNSYAFKQLTKMKGGK
jgi:hypothetical protein